MPQQRPRVLGARAPSNRSSGIAKGSILAIGSFRFALISSAIRRTSTGNRSPHALESVMACAFGDLRLSGIAPPSFLVQRIHKPLEHFLVFRPQLLELAEEHLIQLLGLPLYTPGIVHEVFGRHVEDLRELEDLVGRRPRRVLVLQLPHVALARSYLLAKF